jgi:hypothetical protein
VCVVFEGQSVFDLGGRDGLAVAGIANLVFKGRTQRVHLAGRKTD